MQVTETLSEGLKREYKVVVPASELDAKVNARLDELKDRVRINGFRPGKVPVTHLKRMYGETIPARNLHFIMGTMAAHPRTFIVIGLLRSGLDPAELGKQGKLF